MCLLEQEGLPTVLLLSRCLCAAAAPVATHQVMRFAVRECLVA
jgi:hypothetical protein